MNMSDINILYSNINSYTKKKHLINNYIENNNISCAMFVEAKINNKSNTSYRDWTVLRQEGNQLHNYTRGGSLIQSHPELKMGKENPPRINNPLNECLHFNIPFLEDKLHIFLVYIHPNARIEENIFTKSTLYKYSIIVGDFNASNNRLKKRQINNFIQNTNFSKYDTPPTFIMPNNNDSTPDCLLYSDNIKNNIQVELTPDLCSDHLGFKIKIDTQKPITHKRVMKFNLKKTNINKVNETMLNYLDNSRHIDKEHITNFNSKLSETIIQNTPKTEMKYYTHELPPFIIQLIKRKRKMYREYRNNNDPIAKTELNKYNKNIQKLITEFKTHNWIKTCENINKQKGKNYWYEIKKLAKYNNKNETNRPIEENGKNYETPEEKADIFAKHFETTYKEKLNNNFDNDNYMEIENWYETYITERIPVEHHIEEADYFEILNQGKSTAPGHDMISKNILKQLDLQIHLHIIKIYEFCLVNQYIPEEWKLGTIVTIPKPNTDHAKATNFRPITLLPVIGKNFEKLIKKKIEESVGHRIPDYQFGFKPKCSTLHPLVTLVNNIETTKLNGGKTTALFIDIEKAFDSIWHKGIIYKLYKLDCPKYIILLVDCFLKNRRLKVKVSTSFSYEFTPEQGLPQGSPLSPLLYNIFCADMYYHPYNEEQHFSHSAYILQYADDTTLISHNTSIVTATQNLQNLIQKTTIWFNKWRLKPNPAKSRFIIFNHNPGPNSPTLNMYNHLLYPKTSTKYLGIIIDHKINFNSHTAQIKRNIISRSKHFRCLVHKKGGINIQTASKIYKTICRPMIEYGHVLFQNCKKPAIQKLMVAETSALRLITKIRHPNNPLHNPPNQLLYQLTNIEPIQERLTTLSRRFSQNVQNKELIDTLCARREPNGRARLIHPSRTLWEIINSN